MRKLAALLILPLGLGLHAQTEPEIVSWLLNTDGTTGYYYTSGSSTPASNGIEVNVQQVRYSTNNVYINSTGVPAYTVGPYLDGNPAQASDAAYLFRIPRNPVENTGTDTETGLGHTGILINGVPIYNYSDARSYMNMGIWNQNAIAAENSGFDCSRGHPAPGPGMSTDGSYHHHQAPIRFDASFTPSSSVCTSYPSAGLYTLDSTAHSPLIGYAFDGFPIYGAYSYSNPDGTGGIRRMESSYRLRSITDRHTLPDGTVLTPSQYGPAIGTTYPLGYYAEDFEFVSGLGDLDEHNGRVQVTPEYPAGIYCYFATVDENWATAYPYFIGPTYYGIVATDNFPSGPGGGSTSVVVSEPTSTWTGTWALEQTQLQDGILLYPNPAQDRAEVRLGVTHANMSARLTDLTGRVVREFGAVHQAEFSLDLEGISPGTYLFQLSADGLSAGKVLQIQ
jgi:hypothetical protein